MRNYEYNYLDHIRKNVVPDAHKKHYGSYMSFDDRPISPGCMACKTGGWLCVFIGTRCNCTCVNCPNTQVNKGLDISTVTGVDGSVDIETILCLLERPYFKGVGISGGEPLLYMDKLVDWITRIKSAFPALYVWSYTNGVFAVEKNLKRLAQAGLDELRFDLAADNYSEQVLNNMKSAAKIIPAVGIEVPVILEQYGNLVKAIDLADAAGVKYLNLHDLYVNEKMHKNGLGGYIRSFDKVSGIQRDIHSSAILIYRIFRHIKDQGLSIVPNDCTLINMQMQTFSFRYQQFADASGGHPDFNKYMEMILESWPEEELLIENL